MPITASGTTRDKQNKSYVESPSRGSDWTAQEVYVGNGPSNPIPVDPTTRGTNESTYNEISLDALSTGAIIDFTVPVGKGIDMKVAECSGGNRAIFHIEIDSAKKSQKRTYFTEYNVDFFLSELNATAGQNVKIVVENRSNSSAFFNATLHYNEYDL